MKLFTIVCAALFISDLYGQETTLVMIAHNEKTLKAGKISIGSRDDYVEEYYVLSSDKNVRHGTYVKYRKILNDIQLLASGSYQNGQQHGPWQFYHNLPHRNIRNSIEATGHFVNGKQNGVWKFFYLDTIPEITNRKVVGTKKNEHVSFSVDQQNAKLRMVGMYLNDKRISEWTSFSYAGTICQRYNFSKRMLIFDSSIGDTTLYNVNTRALFVGGPPNLVSQLSQEFSFSAELVQHMKNDSVSVTVSFVVDQYGKCQAPKVVHSTGNEALENEALRIVEAAATDWIPAVENSVSVDSENVIKVVIAKTPRPGKSALYSVTYRIPDK